MQRDAERLEQRRPRRRRPSPGARWTSCSGHARSVRSAPSVDAVPGEADVRAEVLEPARGTSAQRPQASAGSSATRSPRARPVLDRRRRTRARGRAARVRTASPIAPSSEPVPVGAAETDGRDAHEDLARLRVAGPARRAAAGRRRRAGEAPSRLAVVGGRPVLAREVALEQRRRRSAARVGSQLRASLRGQRATASSATAFSTASSTSAPHANGPCEATSAAGTVERIEPATANASTITSPVAPRSRPRSRAAVSARVTGTGPSKWSACVVPKHGSSRRACAQAVANGECVCTTPPTSRRSAVEDEVRRRVRGGPRRRRRPRRSRGRRRTIVIGVEPVVGDAARLDRHHARRAVDGARVAEREGDEAGADEREVRRQDALAQLGVLQLEPPASR